MPGEVALRPGSVGLDPNRADEIRLGARNVTKLFRDARSAAEKFCDTLHVLTTNAARNFSIGTQTLKFKRCARIARRLEATRRRCDRLRCLTLGEPRLSQAPAFRANANGASAKVSRHG
jgi:hypothetical protein